MQRLNNLFRESFGDDRLGSREFRRKLLSERVGRIRRLNRLSGPDLEHFLGGRTLVGVDGSVNSFGGPYPHYVDFLRAMAKPSAGEAIVLKELHSPLPGEDDRAPERRNDQEIRQQKLAALEVRAAVEAAQRHQPPPAMILMDGPLVRFDMRARESFTALRNVVVKKDILLTGCIENIESRVISTLLGDEAPAAWRGRYDTDLLWETLEPGEVLEVSRPAKGLAHHRPEGEEGAAPIRTWFMRASLAPGVVGLEMLEEQVARMGRVADYLYTITPQDGRGIPVWIDLVDREVRLTDVELEAYLQVLDPQLRRLFTSKRSARNF
ncbi:MAG: DNA double-strand break repair nuclease NurA [Bacillota bacterium]